MPIALSVTPPAIRHVAALKLVSRSSLNAGEKALLHAMVEWWNPVTNELWPSVATLAQATGYSDRGVQRIVRRLTTAGVIELVAASSGGSGHTNRYRLRLERLSTRQPNPDPRSPCMRAARIANPDPPSPQPRPSVSHNPDRRSDEPPIPNPSKETSIGGPLANQARARDIASVPGCMDWRTVAESGRPRRSRGSGSRARSPRRLEHAHARHGRGGVACHRRATRRAMRARRRACQPPLAADEHRSASEPGP
jgi:hypothetical protein